MDEKQSETNSFYSYESKNSCMELENYLKESRVWFRFIDKPETIHTKDAALHTGIELNRVTKSLVFLVDKNPVMIIVPGDRRVDTHKLEHVLGTKDIRLVNFKQAKKYSGYEPGATPPVFHKNITKTIIDKSLLRYDIIFGGGGTRNKLIEMKTEDILRLTNAIIEDVVI